MPVAQLGLSLGGPEEAAVARSGLFWVCPTHLVALLWMPPDYTSGRCVRCGEVFHFNSRWGADELVAAGGKAF